MKIMETKIIVTKFIMTWICWPSGSLNKNTLDKNIV